MSLKCCWGSRHCGLSQQSVKHTAKGRRDVLVNDVCHTVGDQDVGCNNLSAVHEYIATFNGYGEVDTVHGHNGLILEGGTVGDGAVDD